MYCLVHFSIFKVVVKGSTLSPRQISPKGTIKHIFILNDTNNAQMGLNNTVVLL